MFVQSLVSRQHFSDVLLRSVMLSISAELLAACGEKDQFLPICVGLLCLGSKSVSLTRLAWRMMLG